jgi:hypothetical protein
MNAARIAVGRKDEYVERAMATVRQYVPEHA